MSDYRRDVDDMNDEYSQYEVLCHLNNESPMDYNSKYWMNHYELLKGGGDNESIDN